MSYIVDYCQMVIMNCMYELQPVRVDDAKNAIIWTTKQIFSLIMWFLSFFQLKNIPKVEWKTIALITTWSAGYWAFLQWELGSLYIMISILVAMFMNLGERRKGELSAYSVFNKGFRNLPGQLRGEDIDREIRHIFERNNDVHNEIENDNDFDSESVDETNENEQKSDLRSNSTAEKPSQKKSNMKGFDSAHDAMVQAAVKRLKRRIQKV